MEKPILRGGTRLYFHENALLNFAGMMEALHEELRATHGPNLNVKFTVIYPYMVDTGLCKKPRIKWVYKSSWRFAPTLSINHCSCAASCNAHAVRPYNMLCIIVFYFYMQTIACGTKVRKITFLHSHCVIYFKRVTMILKTYKYSTHHFF